MAARIAPHSVGSKPETPVGVEASHRLHEAEIALGDDLAEGEAIAAVSHRNAGDEAKVRGNEHLRGGGVLVLLPAFREQILLLGLKHGKAPDLFEIPC